MKKLPIGISGLEKIITGNYVYVDKTNAEKYLSSNKPVYLIGISFDSQARNVIDLISERLDA
ncbi:hypothetical protein [Caedibacter taeniospiralis]|jgi:hypothetical protein|uniref:hypothetical protein n=1 Tax=Caedibacter taeniospiralis TaxID=28907 RepID=UPI0037BE80E9